MICCHAMRLTFLAFLLLPACTGSQAEPQPAPPPAISSVPPVPVLPLPPVGARMESSGFVTILEAPHVPYPDAPPAPPREQETERLAREQGISVSYAERMMNPDAATMRAAIALDRRLTRESRGNYVDVQIVRDPRPRYQFHFRRNGPETLARFTRDPRFRAVTGGVPADELQPLLEEWMRRFQAQRLTNGGSVNPFEGAVMLDLGVSRSEFSAIAAPGGWQIPTNVRLNFAPEIDAAQLISAEAAPFVRTFPRADRAPGITLDIAQGGWIILVDGCFRLNNAEGPLVLFGRNTRLFRDDQGYLTVASTQNAQTSGRIGEHMTWGGYGGPVEDEPGVRAIRRHCGDDPIASVGEPQSTAWFRVRPHAIASYAGHTRLSLQAAWDAIKACWAEQDARRGQPNAAPYRDCDVPGPVNPPPPPPRPPRR